MIPMNDNKLLPLSIIVPTLMEMENINKLIPMISAIMTDEKILWEMIIVDDNSNDGTDNACKEFIQKGMPVNLIVRTGEKGLATAVMEGFNRANGFVFLVMDADLSHPPECIPMLYRSIMKGAEFAIGSRYIPGGGTDDHWTAFRYLNSKFATLLAKPFANISDPMSGFFALPRNVWERGMDINPIGYKIGLELIVKCRPNRIEEIPIYFHTRQLGKSKLTIRQQWLYLVHIFRLYQFKLKHLYSGMS